MSTLSRPFQSLEEFKSPHVVKVVTNLLVTPCIFRAPRYPPRAAVHLRASRYGGQARLPAAGAPARMSGYTFIGATRC